MTTLVVNLSPFDFAHGDPEALDGAKGEPVQS